MTDTVVREKAVTFEGPCGRIEGRLAESYNTPGNAVLALHPHPQYGGTMSNNVVKTVIKAGQETGFATLRFNTRGVGRSEGVFANGIGEQDDLAAAIDFLKRETGQSRVAVVGYSFGASVALRYCYRSDHGIDHLFLVAPPPFLLPKKLALAHPVVKKIVLGERDDIAPPEAIRSLLSKEEMDALIHIIPGEDHFFMSKESALEKVFSELFLLM